MTSLSRMVDYSRSSNSPSATRICDNASRTSQTFTRRFSLSLNNSFVPQEPNDARRGKGASEIVLACSSPPQVTNFDEADLTIVEAFIGVTDVEAG